MFGILKLVWYIIIKSTFFFFKRHFFQYFVKPLIWWLRDVFYAPMTPGKLVLRSFHSRWRFGMMRDMTCGWGQVKCGASASWEIIKNNQKWPKINENQWKLIIFDDFSKFVYSTNTFILLRPDLSHVRGRRWHDTHHRNAPFVARHRRPHMCGWSVLVSWTYL